jgi:hypothetical protein
MQSAVLGGTVRLDLAVTTSELNHAMTLMVMVIAQRWSRGAAQKSLSSSAAD